MIGKSNDFSSRLKHAISHFKQDYPTEKIVFASSGSVLVSKDIQLKPNFFRWYFAKRTNIIISERRLYIKSFSLSFNAISVLLSIILTIGAFIHMTFFLPRMDIPIVNELLLFTKFFIGFIIAFLIVIYFYGCIPYSKVIRSGEINTAYIRPIRILLILPLLSISCRKSAYHIVFFHETPDTLHQTIKESQIKLSEIVKLKRI